MKTYIWTISFLTLINGFGLAQGKLDLQSFVEKAISKSLIGNDPIIVANPFSAKIYSKLDLKHVAWNKLQPGDLIIIPKNSELLEKLWGKQAADNGVVIFRKAQDNNYNLDKLKFIVNGKEVHKIEVEKIESKHVNTLIIVKDRNSEERVAFIDTVK